MKLIDLPEQQIVIEGDIRIPGNTTTFVGYKHQGKPITGAKVPGIFDCSNTKIKSLEQGPSYVGGWFYCWNTNITSLEQGPSYVGDDFYCSHTSITSLQGGPSWVGGDFICYLTNISSLHNIHKEIKHIGRRLLIPDIVKSHVLGVVFIEGLQEIQFYYRDTEQKQVENIINKHLAEDRNIHLAQEELLESGLSEYAKL